MKFNFHFKLKAALWLALLLFSLLCQGQNAKAQYDTVWTRMTERSIVQIAFHPNSQLIATGTWDSYLSIWDIEGNELQRLWGAQSNKGVEFSSNGKYLTYGGGDLDEGAVKVVVCNTWKELMRVVCPTNSLAFINDSNLIVIGGRKDIRIWDFQKNEVVKYIDSIVQPDSQGSYYELCTIIYSPLNNSLIYTASDGYFRFYNLTDNKIDYTLNNPSRGNLALSQDKRFLALQSSSDTKAVQIMDVETKQIVQTFPGSASGINSIVFSPDGKYLAVAYEYSKVLKIWDIQTGKNVYSYIEKPGWYFNAIDWSKDNLYIVGGTNGAIFLYTNKMVGVHEGENNYDTLYPNPTKDFITIVIQNFEHLQSIEIFDIFGERVLVAQTHSSEQKIDVSSLPPGVYFVRVGNEKPMKFVKM